MKQTIFKNIVDRQEGDMLKLGFPFQELVTKL